MPPHSTPAIRTTNAEQVSQSVAEYYDKNTKRFLATRLPGSGGAIHRALWAPGVTDRRAAVNYVNELIAFEIERVHTGAEPHGTTATSELRGPETESAPPVWLDLGCGVGGSLEYLSGRLNERFIGITLSSVQRELAETRLSAVDREPHPTVIQGDFCSPTLYTAYLAPYRIAGAYMVESFLHALDPAALMGNLGRALQPGGALILCDDFLTAHGLSRLNEEHPLHRRERSLRRSIEEFKRGWHAGALLTVEQTEALAASAGLELERNSDLTPFIELGRPRDRFVRVLVGMGKLLRLRGPRWSALAGGNALQQCLRLGLVHHRFLVFRKPA